MFTLGSMIWRIIHKIEVGLLSRLHPLVALLKLIKTIIITKKYNIKFTPFLHIYSKHGVSANTTLNVFTEQRYNKGQG